MRAVERQQVVQVDVGDAITPGEHEGLAAKIGSQPLDAATRLRLHAGID